MTGNVTVMFLQAYIGLVWFGYLVCVSSDVSVMLRIVTVFVLMSDFLGWPCEEEDVGSQNRTARHDSRVAVPLPVAAPRGSEHSVLGRTQSSPDAAHVRSV